MVTLEAREGHDAEVRRDGVERLAAAARALADAIAVTAVDRATLDEVSGTIEMLIERALLSRSGNATELAGSVGGQGIPHGYELGVGLCKL